MHRPNRLGPILISLIVAGACDCSDGEGSTTDSGPGTGIDGGPVVTGDGGPIVRQDGGITITEDGGATFTCYVTVCDGHTTECGDCMDNDGDGRVDFRDQECLGPCDNSEGPQLTTGVGGEGGTSCNRDCYFDYGNGSGNDTCRWDTSCDENEPDHECSYEPGDLGGMRCPDTQTELCLDVCRPLTPNGCDCFGCCTFDALAGRAEADGGEWVWLGSGHGLGPDGEGTCSFDAIMDTEACRPCDPVADCFNDCGRCEVCLGRPMPPADCFETPDGGTPAERCDPGVQPCGLEGDAECPMDFYCITGCCQSVII